MPSLHARMPQHIPFHRTTLLRWQNRQQGRRCESGTAKDSVLLFETHLRSSFPGELRECFDSECAGV